MRRVLVPTSSTRTLSRSLVVNALLRSCCLDKAAKKEKGNTLKYIYGQQLKRFLVIALMVGYTYLQLKRIVPFNWQYLVVLYVVGLFVIIIITHKIRIVSAHIEHHKREANNHHDI
jgi:F0F1-type ATP synthase assembly protein I